MPQARGAEHLAVGRAAAGGGDRGKLHRPVLPPLSGSAASVPSSLTATGFRQELSQGEARIGRGRSGRLPDALLGRPDVSRAGTQYPCPSASLLARSSSVAKNAGLAKGAAT